MYKVGDKVLIIGEWNGWGNFNKLDDVSTIGKTGIIQYQISHLNELCYLIVLEKEEHWYTVDSISLLRKEKLKKILCIK